MASGCSGDDVPPAKEAERHSVPNPWRRATPAASDTDDSLMGGAELWPTLSAAAAAKAKTPASSAAAVASPPKPTGAPPPISRGNPGASSSLHGDRTASVPRRCAAAPELPPMYPNRSSREMRTDVPEQSSPAHALNHRANNAPHPHARAGRGYNGAGSRRPVGSANERGNVDVHVHVNGNGRGGWRGQEHRGGFDGQHRGRAHHQHGHHGPVQHRPQGPQIGYAEPPSHPHPMHPPLQPLPLQPFIGMLDPLTPYYGYAPYAYPEYAPAGHYFAPLPESLPPFVPYPALPMHTMHPHLEQQAAAGAPYMEQHHQAPQEQQEARPNQQELQAAALTPDQVEGILRAQIEYYFSPNNLSTDTYLRERMDEQGWVPLTVIAGFPRIKEKTNDMDLILKAVLTSTEVEVQDGKLRRRVGWEIYPLRRIN